MVFFILGTAGSFAEELSINNIYKLINEYEHILTTFSKNLCRPGDEQKYNSLLAAYRGDGQYIPEIRGELDLKTVKSHIPTLITKVKYIQGVLQKVQKDKFPNKSVMKNIQDNLTEIMLLKKTLHGNIKPAQDANIKIRMSSLIIQLKKSYAQLIKDLYFLTSFNYPNDHLKNRYEYDTLKVKEGDLNKQKSNAIYFLRKIVEDGTYDSKHQNSDLFLRSTLDTLALAIDKLSDDITENVRFDLEWSLKQIEVNLRRGQKEIVARTTDWLKRAQSSLDFYQKLIKPTEQSHVKQIIAQKNQKTSELIKFVEDKQKEIYLFWLSQDDIYKKMYVMESILFNEVGRLDTKAGLERQDVSQVVLNRIENPLYNTLLSNQALNSLFTQESKLKADPWLDTLFRTGEFSFTYYFISSVVKTFCPDMSKIGKLLRKENLKIGLKKMLNPDPKFKAVRYFSRISMLGKIDMSTVWEGFERIPERPGIEADNQIKLYRSYIAGNYKFYYSFEDAQKRTFAVVEIADKTYAMLWKNGKPIFHHYRNPHLFTYFYPRSI